LCPAKSGTDGRFYGCFSPSRSLTIASCSMSNIEWVIFD